jgi:hypothetical protein
MDTLTGSIICMPQRDSAYWSWIALLTDEGIVQLLIRPPLVQANGGLPPRMRIKVRGDWLRVCEENRPWFFVVDAVEVVENPHRPPTMAPPRS